MPEYRILILGGYGNFGKRIAENLSHIKGITLLVAGRSPERAASLCNTLIAAGASADLIATKVDIVSPEFFQELAALKPDLVIHTGGPFQGLDYSVPKACVAIGSHYIDLADDRRFVNDINQLDKDAKHNDVLVVSGASSVPGLSATVIDSFTDRFSTLEAIDFAIAPGNKAERGEATVRGILSYTGRPFPVYYNGQWINRYGWMSARKLDFGKVIGKRWLANVDIPDLELFPERYPSTRTVIFQAGLELPFLHLGMVMMAALARIRLVKNWSVFTRSIFTSSKLFNKLGTDTGGMQINLTGKDEALRSTSIKWTLCAQNGIGPYIPTLSAVILAKKLIDGSIQTRGATPCLGLYTMEEFDKEASPLGIYHQTEVSNG